MVASHGLALRPRPGRPRDSVPDRFRSGWRDTRRLLRGPLRTLVLGQALGQAGDGLAQISFAQLVLFDIGRGATPARIAGVLAATLLPFSVVGPAAGVLIDRWDRRRTLVAVSWARAVLALAAVPVAVARSQPVAYLGVLLLLSSSRFVLDAKAAVLPRTVRAEDLVSANAISGLVGMAAAFAGAVGGSLFVSRSAALGFVSATACYLLAGALFGRLPWAGGLAGRRAARPHLLRELRAGLRAVAGDPAVGGPLAAVWLHRTLLGAGFVLLVLTADRRYHLSASGYGLALAVTGLSAVAGTLLAPWLSRRWRARALLPLAYLPPAAAAAVAGYAPTLGGLLAALGVTAVSFQALKVLADALVGRAAADVVRGRVFAVYDVLYNVAFVLAGLAMIPLWRIGRERPLLWWLAAAFAGGWLLFARAARGWPFEAHPPARAPAAHRWWWRAAALGAGALPVLAFPRPGLAWLAWVGLLPWLALLRYAPAAREAALRGWWGAFGFLLAVHYWLLPTTTVFLPLAAAALGLLWVPWAALAWHFIGPAAPARRLLAGVLVVPAGWTLVEALRSWAPLGGPWGVLGASQWATPVLLAPAALGGVWLVSFLIVAANTALLAVLTAARLRLRALAAALAGGCLAADPLWYAAAPPAAGRSVSVAVVQPGPIADARQRLAAGLALTGSLAAGRYALVVWGESGVGYDLATHPAVAGELAAQSRRLGADLLVNVDARGPSGAIRKTSVLVTASGPDGSYDKTRLVPFGEYIPLRPLLGWLASVTRAAAVNRVPGHRLVVLHAGPLALAPLICFEAAFPDLSRRDALAGAQLLVYSSADTTFQGSWEPDQHASLAAVRAVETGRPALQATLSGTTALFDANGRRLAWFGTGYRGVIGLRVPLGSRDTPYLRFGDWVLAWSIGAVAGAALVTSLRR